MTKWVTFLSLMLVCVLPLTLSVSAKVAVTINQQQYTFNEPPRLTEVLAPVALNQAWYWPASKLFRLETTEPETEREQLLTEIARLAQLADDNLALSLASLAAEIKQWQLAKRIVLPIDYDLARVQAAANPRFEPGAYQLLLTHRVEQVTVFGAINRTLLLAHQGPDSAFSYLSQLNLSKAATSKQLWLIQPNGTVILLDKVKAPLVAPMPGALLFVPFANKWFSNDLNLLNQRVVALAVNRMF